MKRSLEERFWAKAQPEPNTGCWLWLGNIQPNGYSYISSNNGRTNRIAHRVAYELLVGPIPEHLEIDHLCRNRECVNPQHLEAVTHSVNQKRSPVVRLRLQKMAAAALDMRITNLRASSTCRRGHLWNRENTYYYPNSPRGQRGCRICQNESLRRRRLSKKKN